MALPDGTLALTLGTGIALVACFVVLRPLLEDEVVAAPDGPAPVGPSPARDGASAIEALREIEFDRVTGKLSDADYATLKATYTEQALAELRAKEARERRTMGVAAGTPLATVGGDGVAAGDDAVEAALAAFRTRAARCPEHGVRAQPDALFCSDCGRYLAATCPSCGARCEREGQRFCTHCGTVLAA